MQAVEGKESFGRRRSSIDTSRYLHCIYHMEGGSRDGAQKKTDKDSNLTMGGHEHLVNASATDTTDSSGSNSSTDTEKRSVHNIIRKHLPRQCPCNHSLSEPNSSTNAGTSSGHNITREPLTRPCNHPSEPNSSTNTETSNDHSTSREHLPRPCNSSEPNSSTDAGHQVAPRRVSMEDDRSHTLMDNLINPSSVDDGSSCYPESAWSIRSNNSFSEDEQSSCASNAGSGKGFVRIDTLRKQSNSSCLKIARVSRNLVRHEDSSYDKLEILLENLRKSKVERQSQEIRQTLLVDTLPSLELRKNIADIAKCIRVPDTILQRNAIGCLDRILLNLERSKIPTDSLLVTAETTYTAFLQLSDDDPYTPLYANIYIWTLSALLICSTRPSLEQCLPFLASTKSSKKHNCRDGKLHSLKAVQQFSESFKDRLENLSSFPLLSTADRSEKSCKKRKETFVDASFCVQMAQIYSVLNEIAVHGWGKQGEKLLTDLKEFYTAVRPKDGKIRQSPEARTALDFLIVHGLSCLLNTTFREEKAKVGEFPADHQTLIINLIEIACEKSEQSNRKLLVKELAVLRCHSSQYVRQIVNRIIEESGCPTDFAVDHLMHILQPIGFHLEQDSTLFDTKNSECEWRQIYCLVSGKFAECSAYIPSRNCLVQADLKKCLDNHPHDIHRDAELRKQVFRRSERHKRNFSLLSTYSHECDKLIKVLAYQTLPFPFYIHERVEGRRLLNSLLDHRHETAWLDRHVKVKIAQDVLSALIFLTDHNIAVTDVTSYNMVVMQEGETRRSSQSLCSVLSSDDFVVKLADLGSAHTFRKDHEIYGSMDIACGNIFWSYTLIILVMLV